MPLRPDLWAGLPFSDENQTLPVTRPQPESSLGPLHSIYIGHPPHQQAPPRSLELRPPDVCTGPVFPCDSTVSDR